MARKLDSLESLYLEQLKDLYSAENQLIEALPKMAEAAHSPDLQRGFTQHLEQTHKQAKRIEQIFNRHKESLDSKKCKGMEGLIKEGEEMIKEKNATPSVQDAGLIAAAQRVEHYEISGYGTVHRFAEMLGFQEDARLLKQSLDEEYATDEKLTEIAEKHINEEAIVGT